MSSMFLSLLCKTLSGGLDFDKSDVRGIIYAVETNLNEGRVYSWD